VGRVRFRSVKELGAALVVLGTLPLQDARKAHHKWSLAVAGIRAISSTDRRNVGMIDQNDFATVDRIGNVIGRILTVGCFALVLWPIAKAVL
jgi:hypothetical protein